MSDYKATPEQWVNLERRQLGGNDLVCAALELRARVEALEDAAQKHIVETSSNIGASFRRIESLEAAERQASKVYEISKPLKLTAKQQKELNALLQPVTSKPSPNSSQIRSSLVERVVDALANASGSDWKEEARAAIREVAAWIEETQHDHWSAVSRILRFELDYPTPNPPPSNP